MKGKTSKVLLYETHLDWVKDKKGALSAPDVEGVLYVETPPAFGGQGKPWSAEHLFLGSISSCFLSTFIAFAKKMDFKFRAIKTSVIGQISQAEGHYQFTQIDMYPVIYIAGDEPSEKGGRLLELTYKHCLITRSLAIPVFYHTQIKTFQPVPLSEKWQSLPLEGKEQHIIV